MSSRIKQGVMRISTTLHASVARILLWLKTRFVGFLARVKARAKMPSRKTLILAGNVLAVSVASLAVFFLVHLPHGPEHWSADLRTAWLSDRRDTKHPRMVLIELSEETLVNYPYTEPVDRKLLADLVLAIDEANAKAIGIDLVFDRATEPSKDGELIQRIRCARAQVILGALDKRTPLTANERKFQADFLDRARRPYGHLYFGGHHVPFLISEDVVREFAASPQDNASGKSFAEMLAGVDGPHQRPKSSYISWLLPPKERDTFLTLPAEYVLGQHRSQDSTPLSELLRDKIVLIGGNFSDRDQHLTPLSVKSGQRYTGTFIHAQIVAQLLDNRSIRVIGKPVELVILCAVAALGFLIGRRHLSVRSHLLIDMLGVTIFISLSIIIFAYGAVIFPFVNVMLAWVSGLAGGHHAHESNH
jgi:CHASE2 domain-containing sensor protein